MGCPGPRPPFPGLPLCPLPQTRRRASSLLCWPGLCVAHNPGAAAGWKIRQGEPTLEKPTQGHPDPGPRVGSLCRCQWLWACQQARPRSPLPPCVSRTGEQIYLDKMLCSVQIPHLLCFRARRWGQGLRAATPVPGVWAAWGAQGAPGWGCWSEEGPRMIDRVPGLPLHLPVPRATSLCPLASKSQLNSFRRCPAPLSLLPRSALRAPSPCAVRGQRWVVSAWARPSLDAGT